LVPERGAYGTENRMILGDDRVSFAVTYSYYNEATLRGGSEIRVFSVSRAGALIFDTSIGQRADNNFEDVFSLAKDNSGNLYVSCTLANGPRDASDRPSYSINLVKLSAQGSQVWRKEIIPDWELNPNYYGAIEPSSLIVQNNNVYLSGRLANSGPFVAKFDFSGYLEWYRSYKRGTYKDFPSKSVLLPYDNNFIVYTKNVFSNSFFELHMIDKDGQLLGFFDNFDRNLGESLLIGEIKNVNGDIYLAGTNNTLDEFYTAKVSLIPQEPNNPPVVVSEIEDITIDEGFREIIIELSEVFIDPDSDELMYSVQSSNVNVVEVLESNDSLSILEQGSGESIISITAEDGRGGSVSEEFTIFVEENPLSVLEAKSRYIFPNPTKGQIYIEGHEVGSEIIVSDLLGRELKSGFLNEYRYFDISEINNGVYILRVISSNETYIYNVIKQ
jgi:hypothetical protein